MDNKEFDADEIMRLALEEVRQERFRVAVELMKEKIRRKRSIWDRLFPFRIIVVRKEKYDVRRKEG